MSRLNRSRNFFSTLVSLGGLVLISLSVTQNLVAQQSYRYDVIATSSSRLQVFAAPSINNNGEVAFAGRNNPGGGVVYTDFLPNQPRDLLPGFSSQPSFTASGQLQINDSRQILSFWLISSTFPRQNYLHVIDGKATSVFTNVAAANGAGQFNDFNEIYPSGLAYNNNGLPVFQARVGVAAPSIFLTAGIRGAFSQAVPRSEGGPIFRPSLSDNNSAVVRADNNGSSSIFQYESVNVNPFPTPIDADTVAGFTQIGQSPSISKFDEAIAFRADLDHTGATRLGTNPGPGIFVSINIPNVQRRTKIIRMAGRLVEDTSASGGNDDGVCDSGETCVQGELGFNQAGNRIFFSFFDIDPRVDVAYIPSGRPGIEDDLIAVSFLATPNIASDLPGNIFNNQQGLWTLTGSISSVTGDVRKPAKRFRLLK